MIAGEPFPPFLKWTLLASIAIWGVLALMGLVVPSARDFGQVLLGVALLIQLIAVPIAIWFLLRGGYWMAANIAMTVVAGLPWLVIVLAVIGVFLGFTKVHF